MSNKYCLTNKWSRRESTISVNAVNKMQHNVNFYYCKFLLGYEVLRDNGKCFICLQIMSYYQYSYLDYISYTRILPYIN